MIKRKRNEALEEQYRLQGSCCLYCKENVPYELITRDHFLPVSKGNTLVNNKVFACRTCNNIKGNKSLVEFKDFLIKKSFYLLEKEIVNNKKLKKYELSLISKYMKAAKTIEEFITDNKNVPVVFT
jgi:5-methylcytosine-specific restriction endonuclease McrA